jgi:predicted dehydrogenase
LPVAQDLILPPPPPVSNDPRQKTAEWTLFAQAELGPYTQLCDSWRRAIEGKSADVVRPPTFADGLASMTVMDAIRASAADGGKRVAIG